MTGWLKQYFIFFILYSIYFFISLKTTLCLRYKPEQIAAAAVLLAAKLLKNQTYENAIANPDVPFCNEKIDVLEGTKFFARASLTSLIEIYVQILDLYENCPGVNALKKRGVVSSVRIASIFLCSNLLDGC